MLQDSKVYRAPGFSTEAGQQPELQRGNHVLGDLGWMFHPEKRVPAQMSLTLGDTKGDRAPEISPFCDWGLDSSYRHAIRDRAGQALTGLWIVFPY